MLNLKIYEAVNWNKKTSSIAEVLWDQQLKQIWQPQEIAISNDLLQWKSFEHKETYKKVLAGLTLLDTIQTNIGMNEVVRYVDDLQEKALFTLFDAFEAIHAKSYSYIFTTLCTNSEIDELFEWVKENKYLQYKANRISDIYLSIEENDDESLWKAMFASVMLESFLFYSGFFYPLYNGGQGILRNSSEIISLILRDESIHGVGVGFSAQNIFNKLSETKQNELKEWGYELLIDLYNNECLYTEDVYGETELIGEVKKYVRYNGNKALMNVGFDTMFPEEEVHPIIMNGIKVGGTTHDFFSQKNNSYTLAKVANITNNTFNFENVLDDYN